MAPIATTTADTFALGGFLARWGSLTRYDLSGSESATLTLNALLSMAEEDDRRRWHDLALGYADPRGATWLRAEVAARHRGLEVEDVLCCAGAQEAIICIMRALLGTGDHAIVVVPIYQPSEHAVTSVCAVTGVPLERNGDWHLDIGRVAAAIRPNTRLVLMNFPNSPTGALIDSANVAALITLCRDHGLWLVNDEVYREMTDGPPADPIAGAFERGISINAVSKGLGLPGLRVGWIACQDRALLAKALVAKSRLSSYLSAPAEILAHVALRAEDSIVGQNKRIALSNRRMLREFLGLHPDVFQATASGQLAFDAPRYVGSDSAERFATELVGATGVLVPPFALWRSKLAEIPLDQFRIRLGGPDIGSALAAMESHLAIRAI